MKSLDRFSPPFLAFLQATGLVVYIGLIALFFTNAEQIFEGASMPFLGSIFMLLLFVISATISALLVLGRAGMLFWEKKYNDAFTILGYTLGWGVLYLVLTALIILFQK